MSIEVKLITAAVAHAVILFLVTFFEVSGSALFIVLGSLAWFSWPVFGRLRHRLTLGQLVVMGLLSIPFLILPIAMTVALISWLSGAFAP